MKNFEVGFYLSVSGKSIVEANSQAEAEHIMREYIAENGIDNLEYKAFDREFDATGVTEIKGYKGVADISKESFKPFTEFEEDE